MKMQEKLEGLASTAFERKVIRLWLREGRARSSFVRALGESKFGSGKRRSQGGNDGLPDGI